MEREKKRENKDSNYQNILKRKKLCTGFWRIVSDFLNENKHI